MNNLKNDGNRSIFINCPSYLTEHFIIRKTELTDAEDLLKCYSDPKAQPHFNADNCNGETFCFETLERMTDYMKFWEREFADGIYVRFSILNRVSGEVVGTIEYCPKRDLEKTHGQLAIVRIDLRSEFETKEEMREILQLIYGEMREDFGSEHVFTKASERSTLRREVLNELGYRKLNIGEVVNFPDYYLK